MSKLVGLKLNDKFGVLEAQECRFETTPDHLVIIKAGRSKRKGGINENYHQYKFK